MITINQHPYPCSFTKNGIEFGISSNQLFVAPKIFPSMQLEIMDLALLGNFCSFKFINPETLEIESIRVLAVQAPEFPGEVADSASVPALTTTADYADMVFQALKKIKILNAYYTLSRTGTVIDLVAKYPISELVFTDFTTNGGGSYFQATIQEGVHDPSEREGYECKAVIYIQNAYESEYYEIAGTIDVVLDPMATAQVDISEILHEAIQNQLENTPIPVDSELIYFSKNLRKYYVEFVEYWDLESLVDRTTSDIYFAHFGGVSETDEQETEPVTLIAGNRNFLTWLPSGKRISENQKDWLSWMNTRALSRFLIRIKVYASTGVVDIDYHITEFFPLWHTITFQTNWKDIALDDALSGELYNKYSFQIWNSAGEEAISEEFIYYKDQVPCIRKTILYFNPFYVPETFVTFGPWSENLEISQELAQRSQQYNLTRSRASRFSFNKTSGFSISAETQEMKQLEAERLSSMISASEAFVFENNRWIPILFSAESVNVYISNNWFRRVAFSAVKAEINENVSFFNGHPHLVITQLDSGVFHFTVDGNGIEIETYGDMLLYIGNTFSGTYVHDGEKYEASTLNETEYQARVDVTDVNGRTYLLVKNFRYQKPIVSWIHDETFGDYQFVLGKEAAAFVSTVAVDWGLGTGFEDETYNASTTILKTILLAGQKTVRLKKTNFNDIIEFKFIGSASLVRSTGREMNISALPNLQVLHFVGCAINHTVYLNSLLSLQEVVITGNPDLTDVEIGYHKNLAILNLEDNNLSSDAIERILLQLATFSGMNTAVPVITFTDNPGASDLTTISNDIINGLGEYAGKGLVADLGWTINV
jgi:hypothetical protein